MPKSRIALYLLTFPVVRCSWDLMKIPLTYSFKTFLEATVADDFAVVYRILPDRNRRENYLTIYAYVCICTYIYIYTYPSLFLT